MNIKKKRIFVCLIIAITLIFSSCSRMGYGVLLWSTDNPPIDSGTILPVYIKSNIEKKWVVGVPENVSADKNFKLEIPLAQFEFVGSRKKAAQWAQEFAPYAMAYAENLQDRLPIRNSPDNNSQQVYRLRLGEVIKILSLVKGVPPISTTGDPLPGAWYRVMTNDGVTGYCFSYRLRIFNQNDKSVQNANIRGSEPDPELDGVLSKTWSSESYLQMINSRRINIQEMEKNYRFDPGYETGIARIILPDIERQFTYERIIPDGERAWIFEGANLQMVLRNNNTLAVQFSDGDTRRTIIFNALSNSIDDIILQEEARRENQYMDIYNLGPVFTSLNYGTITFLQTGDFVWTGFTLLVPQLIPYQANGTGRVSMNIFIASSLEGSNTGAFSMQFADVSANNTIYFTYVLDDQGLRLEVVPAFAIENNIVTRRVASPTVLYFYRDSPY
ncbi:MAG: SH3 domain-containing protein [Treponema sp.]|nr:SH3 domain-containing protein [Treponema sp.]